MEYKFTEVFDIPALTRICEGYTRFSGMVTALLDLEGNVHIATGWQDICTKFHRVNSDTARNCTESDTTLAGQLGKDKPYNVYRCKNGLVDVAIPVIVRGEHVGNFFTGQFFFEAPDVNFFKEQAHTYSFDEHAYLEALDRVPVFTEERVRKSMDFLVELTQLIGEMGVERLSLLQAEERRRRELEELVAQRTQDLNNAKEALELANRELFELSRIDPLTKISNRRTLEDYLTKEWKRAERSGEPLSILMLDVDYFKLFNDHYGHQHGDHCLISVAGEITNCLGRPSDLVGRYGGEEFVCVLPDIPLDGAIRVAKSIQEKIAKLALPHETSPVNQFVTVSIGVACCKPKDYRSPDEVVAVADKCLYQAKDSGRNCVVSQQMSPPNQ